MRGVLQFLYHRAEDVAVALSAVMFAAFIVQIASRYLFNAPTDWTFEIIMISWVWLIFWGSAFLLKDGDHVKFDVLYNLGSEKTRRVLSLIVAVALAGILLLSAGPTWSFVSFKAIRSSDVLGIRMDLIFGVYMLFLAGTILHYALRAFRLLRGDSLSTLEKEETL
jgi:TRAP-type C4-dicarboxylate transport system permease small subunit